MEPKLRFICGACSYRFSRHFRPNLCPYCGKSAVENDTTKGAQDLLHEIEEIERDIQMRNQ